VVREAFRALRSPGLLFKQLLNLVYLVESHTKFPLLRLIQGPIRRAIASSTGYPDLQFSYTLRNILSELNKACFRVIGVIPHYHLSYLKILPIVQSYLIVAFKGVNFKMLGMSLIR